ncbi:heterokaryon incompatibility protein-domain-containing protein [Dactylonectria macrodidyma]|uniref:Heterokaryon incompatibility protein-domain-containing protein n=1 Tax=Dactylonectria macrodidyma TaxID=307937 RepID=A0A9P9EX74_9HYPO|nr:heterokaryon incompatibility protein-domain-containing protein [Dactylonectria macrodidyma]
MACIACKLPTDSTDYEKYNCKYDELIQATQYGCPWCIFMLKCIATGAAHIDAKEILNLTISSNASCEIQWSKGKFVLETFTQLTVLVAGHDNAPLRVIRHRGRFPSTTDCQTTSTTIGSWIEECLTSHEGCRPQIQYSSHPFVCPKRLLDLSKGAVALRENIGQERRYVCLSHCWGTNTHIVKTTTQNIERFRKLVPWDNLTKTFQDAINICRGLRIFYLWIDSLCIIQDSDDDWKEQAAQMADIYQNAFLTVAATKSRDGSGGCFSETSPHYMAKLVPGYRDIYVRQQLSLFPDHWTQLENRDDFPLLNRAWIYQEMRLSPRVLHFCTEEVVWVCQAMRRSESGYNDKDFIDGDTFKPTLYASIAEVPRDKDRFIWHRTVQEYSRLQLTFASDKMVALAGLAQRTQNTRPDDRYLAGMWERHLPLDLLWMVWPTPKLKNQKIPRYPSWSWASTTSQVMWDGIWSPLKSVVVREVRFVSDGPSHMGESSEASINLQAPLIDANSLLSNHVTWRTLWSGETSDTITAVEEIRAEELCVNEYKPDCLTDESAPVRWPPNTSGFVIPLGVDVENSFKFSGIHVIKKHGGDCYERIGHVEISHTALVKSNIQSVLEGIGRDIQSRELNKEARRRNSRAYAFRVKELLEGLQVSNIVLV